MDKKHMKDKAIKLRKIPAVSFKDTAGITLSALVVTIIVLIMLAGVTINVTIGENGIIKKAKETEIQQEIIEITQELKMKKIKVALLDGNKGKVTISEYIEVVQNDEDMEYKITDTQIIDEETAYIIIGEEYEYLLQQEEDGDLKITYQGIANQSLPRIQDLQISSSENEIEVKVMATRVEKYVFYIKEKDAAEYIKKEENETGEYIFRELTSNKEYSIKVEAINENGKSEREINQITGGMIELTPSEVKYIKSDTNWTNEDVTTTIEIDTDKNITNYELQYTKFTEGAQVTSGALENATWLKYETTGIVSEENEIIYTRLYNGNNATSYTSTTIANIDKEAPTISETLNSSGVTTKGFTLNIGVTDISSGLGKIIWYYKLSNASNYSSQEEIYTPLNGVATGEKAAVTKSITLDNLTNGTYSVYAEVYDVAGNSTETEKINIPLVGITQASGATVSPEYWTNGTVIVTLPTQDGFTMEYQTGTLDEDGTWIPYDSTSKVPVSNNTTVYYRYNDGKNPGQYGSEIVNNIDTENPRISTTLNATGVTTKGFTLNIGVTDTSSGLGRINWCYKLSTESTYTIKSEIYTPLNGTVAGETTATKSITLDNLTNGTYDAYVVIYDVAGNSIASSSIKVPLGTIAQASGATASPAYWTSGTVTVTLPTQSGFTTEYQTGTVNENGTWTPYNSTSKVPVSSNTTVYYRYNDGKNVGVYGSKQVSNIDTADPTISTALSGSVASKDSITLNIGVRDINSGLGKIVWYYKTSNASTYSSQESPYTTINGTITGTTTAVSATKTISGLTNGQTYNIYAVVYDVAGNSIQTDKIDIKLVVTVAASAIKKGVFIEYDVEYTDTYYDTYKYTTTNGWRLLDYKTRDDGKTLYDVQLMSTGIPARMYFYNDDKINNYSKWITDSTKLNEFKAILGNGYNHYTGTNYYALQASAGYYYNLGEMTFTQGTSYDLHNMGYYTTVKNGDTNYTTGVTLGNNLFKTSQASSVRMLTLPELNKALGRTDIDSVSRITDTTGLFQLNQLNSVLSGKSYSEGFYWLASPRPNNALNVCYMASAGFVYGGLAGSHGVRPVVTLSSDIQLVEAVNSEGTTYYEIVNK